MAEHRSYIIGINQSAFAKLNRNCMTGWRISGHVTSGHVLSSDWSIIMTSGQVLSRDWSIMIT